MGRIWTIEERQKQAERIRSQKPWLKSTGPRTTRGKLASSCNATRHGCYGAEFKMISRYLKMQKHYIDTLRFMLKHALFEDETPFEISGNELNENSIKSIQNATDRHVKNRLYTVIARNKMTKQSMTPVTTSLDCFAPLAMTILYPFNRHPSESWDPEMQSTRKRDSGFRRNDVFINLGKPTPTKNPPFLTGSSKILNHHFGRWRITQPSIPDKHPLRPIQAVYE